MKKAYGLLTILSIVSLAVIAYAQSSAKDYVQKGIEYENMEMMDAALKQYETAIALEPDYSDALFNAALLCLRLGQNQKSADYFERVVASNPQDGAAYYHLAITYLRLGKYSEAIKRALKKSKNIQSSLIKRLKPDYTD